MPKRVLDIVLAAAGLILLAPLLAVIAILVKLDSPGPAFFRGERIGKGGKKFYICKFRTMIPDASRQGPAVTCQDDPRITRIGRVLRQTKLDELPSLVNVLKGEMSLVGPRPESPVWVARYTPRQRGVLDIKPGVTGLAQIKYRNEEALLNSADLETVYPKVMSDKLEIDLEYMERRSFFLDLRILIDTALALLGGPGMVKQVVRRVVLDLAIIPFAFYLAWLARFDGQIPIEEMGDLVQQIVPIVFTYIAISAAFGVYRRLWAYASFRDILFLCWTVGAGTGILVVANLVLTHYRGWRLSMGGLLIGGLLMLALSTVIKYRRQIAKALLPAGSGMPGLTPERVLIVGINVTARQLMSQLYLNQGEYEIVGLVDGDLDVKGMNVDGINVLGTMEQIPALVRDHRVDVIAIASHPADREAMWRLISICQKTPAKVKVLPDIAQIIESGYQDPLALRDVSVDDILSRAPVGIDAESCRGILAGKVVLVTGAAGSIGSELCRQILGFGPQLLVALDNNETGLYDLNLGINPSGQKPVELALADVSDWSKMGRVFRRYRPQVVFHAAAYKHVPMLEYHADEALRINVLGTVIVSEMARQFQAERFIFVSTDKAVNPNSVMGATKRIGELWMKAMASCHSTAFATVRFGNVIGSRGSVLPTFARQIEMGGPVTVTDPRMYRYFISIPEAVSLLLQAAAFSKSSEIYMLEMGEAVSILDLAKRMIRLKGLRVDKDITIDLVGPRPGEKFDEELAYASEFKKETTHPSIYALVCPDEPVDHDVLLGVISILAYMSRLPKREQYVREGLFQIAAYDIDSFLRWVAGIDMVTDHHPLELIRTEVSPSLASPHFAGQQD